MTVIDAVPRRAEGPADLVPSRRPVPRILRGRPEDEPWVRPALLCLLVGTALLYTVDLTSSGFANAFYAAAVDAGSHSWRAMFFGSFDASNLISVDKPPAFLWVMDASARLFGFNVWSILLPQAAEGVATVGLLYLTMRRSFSAGTALLAGVLLALTPVATLMFRFNNPDALLTLLLVGATYATLRATESGRSGWVVLAGTLIGFGFLTKLLEALLVVPALGGVYLFSGPGRLRRRLWQLLVGGAALAVAGGWWFVAVAATPASARPYLGGTPDNRATSLIFGYNGLGRLTGAERGSVGFVSTASGGSGPAGWFRLFDAQFSTQVAWFLPAALLGAVVGLWLVRRAPRTDPARAALLAWTGSLLVCGLAFSLGRGIIHTYYSVALAPAIAALAAAGAGLLWQRLARPRARWMLAAIVGVTLAWGFLVLSGAPPWQSSRLAVCFVAIATGAVILGRAFRRPATLLPMRVAVIACVSIPAFYCATTVVTPHATAIPIAGPVQRYTEPRSYRLGGLLVASRPTGPVIAALEHGARSYRWVAAAVGADNAAGYQLATNDPVMAVGGFNGTDPAPTLLQFERYVVTREVHWFVSAGTPPGSAQDSSGTSQAQAITAWVEQHFLRERFGPLNLYDLASPRR